MITKLFLFKQQIFPKDGNFVSTEQFTIILDKSNITILNFYEQFQLWQDVPKTKLFLFKQQIFPKDGNFVSNLPSS